MSCPRPLLASLVAVLTLLPLDLRAQGPEPAEPIRDNSFLIEEGYNQEAGVVQHISAFSRAEGGAWAYAFTQEWPVRGMRHQLSYTIPVLHADELGTGVGDVGLNYRHQLLGTGPEARVHFAPRLTLLLPTGREERERGNGGVGLQANLPLSVQAAPALVVHWNAGLTLHPSARNALGRHATTTGVNLGASAIWLVRRNVNFLVEAVWQSAETVVAEGVTDRSEAAALNPGLRWAFDFAGGLQVVPGVAYTFGVGPSSGDDALFLYLSLEHPFRGE